MPAKTAADTYDPRIDIYINQAQPFAQPILTRLRQLLHKAIPEITETIKWSHAFFEYKGRILANMAAFKAHCSLGFWGQEMTAVLHESNLLHDGGMGSLGRIASPKDLPAEKQLLALFRQAAAFIDQGQYTTPMAARNSPKDSPSSNAPATSGPKKQTLARAAKPPIQTPPDLAAALKTNLAAAQVFAAFSPSCKREYIDWLTEAKRQETREKRLTQAIQMIAEGKQRHWKYQPT